MALKLIDVSNSAHHADATGATMNRNSSITIATHNDQINSLVDNTDTPLQHVLAPAILVFDHAEARELAAAGKWRSASELVELMDTIEASGAKRPAFHVLRNLGGDIVFVEAEQHLFFAA